MTGKFLSIIYGTSLKVISKERLIEYIEFCLEKNLGKRIKGKSALHHILPRAKNLPFGDYSNLKENEWNGVHLLHKDHYYAHWLLTESIEHISILSSFCAMHFKDIKLERISKEMLIDGDLFQEKMEKRVELFNENMNMIVEHEGELLSKYEIIGKKVSKALNKEIEVDGIITTTAQVRGKKLSKTLNKEIEVDGIITTLGCMRAEKSAKTMNIKDSNGLSIYDIKKIKEKETKSAIIEFEGVEMTLARKYSILSARSRKKKQNEINKNVSLAKMKKGFIFDIYYKDKLIISNVPYLYINKNYQTLKGLTSFSKLVGKYKFFWVVKKPFNENFASVEELKNKIGKIIK